MGRHADGLGCCQAAVLVGLVLLAGCTDKKQTAAKAAAAAASRARDAAEQAIRTATPAATQMQFRGVQVYAQAMPQRVAVCGQVSLFADDPNIFVPFVSVVTLPPGGAAGPYQSEQQVGTDPSEANRVYVAIVTYCYDKGGPITAPYQNAPPAPPLPNNLPDSLFKPGKPALAQPQVSQASRMPGPSPDTGSTPASGIVTMRQNGNLHAGPHGPTLRVVPQGTAMHIFAQAPGGWYEVGDTAPWGWMHESMLEKH